MFSSDQGEIGGPLPEISTMTYSRSLMCMFAQTVRNRLHKAGIDSPLPQVANSVFLFTLHACCLLLLSDQRYYITLCCLQHRVKN